MAEWSPLKGFSIVMKVSILVGSVTAVASLIVGSLIISGTSDIVHQNALNHLKYETNIKSINLVSDIKNLSGDAKYLSGTPPILGIPRAFNNNGIDPIDNSNISTWKSRLATIFSELIRAKPNYLQIRYIGITDKGRELVRVERNGKLIQSIPENKLQQKGDTEYFVNTLKINPGEVYLSDVTLNKEFGEISKPHTPVIRATTPIYFNNKIFGVLVINMSFDEVFTELIKNTPRHLFPYVTNEEGYFLAHPDRSKTFGFDLNNNNRIQTTYPDFDLKKHNDLRDTEFTLSTNGDVLHVVKAHYDPVNRKRFFAVMLATSYEFLESGSLELRYKSFLIMGLLVIISIIIASLLASRLMRPLQLISTAAKDIAKGREISELPITASDEIGELARTFDNMRHQIEDKERELLLSQGRVHHSNKMAALGEMASGMAHEINSPIQTISLIAQRIQRQLKKNMSPDEINSLMDKINNSVLKISEIIDSLRRVSRNSTDDNFTETRINDLIQDTVNMTEERFKVNNVNFGVNYHNLSGNMIIQCQRLQISQVLINLVNNAYDSIQNLEHKNIDIDIKRTAEKIEISVTDSGPRISDTIIERIFEPMFTTKEVGKGTGLGLSISQEIIKKHNGSLYIDKIHATTRFIVELPILHLQNKQS